jgi:tetratricopeptide (TPR) repeat protein
VPSLLRRWRPGLLLLLVLASACAKRVALPVVTAPKHPDYIVPAVAPDAPLALRTGIDRGWQYLQAGDLRNAEREFGAALKASPQSASAEAAVGYLALARGRADEALPAFDRALTRTPQFVSALVGRGYALVELKRDGEAVASFEAALKADPSLTDLQARVDVLRFRATQDLLARATSATEAGRLDDARAAYEQAIAASPDSAFLYRDLAGVERKAGLPDRAVEHLRRAVELDAGDARALVALGELLEERGDLVAALSALEAARALDPSSTPAATLARIRDRVAALKLPEPYRAIPAAPQVTRADLAALVGIRLEALVARAAPRQVVITDIRNSWAQQWISTVVRAGIMDTLPNYEFSPQAAVRRGDLARTVSRLLTLISGVKPGVSKKWDNAKVTVSDVPPGHLSYPAVAVAVASGVMPLDNGAFRLLDPVTGSEAVDVIGRVEALAR